MPALWVGIVAFGDVVDALCSTQVGEESSIRPETVRRLSEGWSPDRPNERIRR